MGGGGGAGRGLSPSHKQQNPWLRETFDLSEFPMRSTQHCDPMHEISISIASRLIEFSDFDAMRKDHFANRDTNINHVPLAQKTHYGRTISSGFRTGLR